MIRLPQWLSIRRKPMIKNAVSAVVFAVFCAVYLKRIDGAWFLADSLFLTCLLFLMLGLWNLVRWLGLFDFTVYSWKRFIRGVQYGAKASEYEAPMPSYDEYLKTPRVIPSAGEPLLCAAVLLVLSILATYIG